MVERPEGLPEPQPVGHDSHLSVGLGLGFRGSRSEVRARTCRSEVPTQKHSYRANTCSRHPNLTLPHESTDADLSCLPACLPACLPTSSTPGQPAEEDLAFVTSARAKRFILSLPPTPPVPLNQLFPDRDERALDLLSKMLQFNPEKRLTAQEVRLP